MGQISLISMHWNLHDSIKIFCHRDLIIFVNFYVSADWSYLNLTLTVHDILAVQTFYGETPSPDMWIC